MSRRSTHTHNESLMSTDALDLLEEDHTEIRDLFGEFERTGENALKAKQALVEQILKRLTVHTYLENEVLYPGVRELLPDVEDHDPDRERAPPNGGTGMVPPGAGWVEPVPTAGHGRPACWSSARRPRPGPPSSAH
jgi:Hemerythrin HHE cation binding domain